MAPKRIQALLATEIEDGKARAAGRYPTADCANGEREPNLGTRADCRELGLKLGVEVSPRTVRAYWPQECDPRNGKKTSSQRWLHLCLSKTSKFLSGGELYFSHNSLLRCSFFSRQPLPLYPRSFVRALPSSWRIWLCATKSASFSGPRENARS